MEQGGKDNRLIAEINLAAITANWRRLVELSGKAKTAAVVKANAYGHGLPQVVTALYAAGCRVFFTASIAEAIAVRTHAPSTDVMISYHDGLAAGEADAIRQHALTPSISDPSQLPLLAGLADNDKPPALLQIDTGMNRLGVDWRWLATESGADAIAKAAAHWQLYYSHLASADEPNSQQNQQQRQRFDLACGGLPAAGQSLAASGGILLGEAYHYDLTRPGIALYGYPPVAAGGFTPALTLKGRVLQIRTLDATAASKHWAKALQGDWVGYNATHKLTGRTRLATVAGGYADGVRRQLSNKGRVAFTPPLTAPIVGRVSMDAIVIDISDWPSDAVAVGDYVTLLGSGDGQPDANTWADWSGTICYDILTGLHGRIKRVYSQA